MPKTETGTKVLKTACYLCHGGCILLAHVKDGKLIKMEGDPDGPHNRGSICEKGNAAIQYIYGPHRLKYPMKRVGKRGENKWQRISWDEALDTIAEKLTYYRDKFGGESIVYGWGTGRVIDNIPFKEFFGTVIGTPNGIGIGHLCLTKTRMPAMTVTTGKMPPPPGFAINRDFEKANCIVGWGDTIIDSRNDFMGAGGTRIADALRRGCKLIAIDPVYTRLAQKSSIWLPIRPGTDIALALAWQHVIIFEGLYDREFVEKWTNAPFLVRMDTRNILRRSDVEKGGNPDHFVAWDTISRAPVIWNSTEVAYEKPNVKPAMSGTYDVKLADGKVIKCRTAWDVIKENLKEWTPEKASEVTWIPAEKIRESAIMYATTKPACIEWGVAMSQCARSTAINQAILQLECITGNFDVRGGNACWLFPKFRNVGLGSRPGIGLPRGQAEKRVTGGFPFSSEQELTIAPSAWQPGVWKQIVTGKPYPIKVYFACDSNPLVGHEKPDRYIIQALRDKLEFIVWADITMTPSTQYADILLPSCTPLERDWVSNSMEAGVFAGQKVIEPVYESKPDFFIYRELTHRMGRGDIWPWKTEEEWCDWQLEEMGITFRELTKTCFTPSPEDWKKYETGLFRKDKKPGFQTTSGKCELYSSVLEKYGIAPIPLFSYPLQSYEKNPELARDYPLILITGSREVNYPFFHSQYRQVPRLREMQPFPMVMIHSDTAAQNGIKDGDWVWVQSKFGKSRFKADVTPRIMPRVVSVTHSWWYPELPPPYGVFESSCNILVDPELGADPGTGTTELRGILCKVYKAEGPPPGVVDKEQGGA
ncbi:MAG: molybdopterin-dependent oxidoreductase [Dehalococcoidia bacterium]|nr:molybdopterin-dependent oxidoreductase [Dehalococcoidia bacterium]